jgi:hypothetical protein
MMSRVTGFTTRWTLTSTSRCGPYILKTMHRWRLSITWWQTGHTQFEFSDSLLPEMVRCPNGSRSRHFIPEVDDDRSLVSDWCLMYTLVILQDRVVYVGVYRPCLVALQCSNRRSILMLFIKRFILFFRLMQTQNPPFFCNRTTSR